MWRYLRQPTINKSKDSCANGLCYDIFGIIKLFNFPKPSYIAVIYFLSTMLVSKVDAINCNTVQSVQKLQLPNLISMICQEGILNILYLFIVSSVHTNKQQTTHSHVRADIYTVILKFDAFCYPSMMHMSSALALPRRQGNGGLYQILQY